MSKSTNDQKGCDRKRAGVWPGGGGGFAGGGRVSRVPSILPFRLFPILWSLYLQLTPMVKLLNIGQFSVKKRGLSLVQNCAQRNPTMRFGALTTYSLELMNGDLKNQNAYDQNASDPNTSD